MALLDIFRRKQKTMKKRGYDGAQTGRLFSDFITSQRSADSELRHTLKTLRNRSGNWYAITNTRSAMCIC